MKKCFKCLKEKELSDFYKHKQMADGHLNKCKSCTKEDVRRDRDISENARIYDRKRYMESQARRDHAAKVAKRWAEKYPEKRKAQWDANNAVRDGRLIRKPCEVCGAKNVHKHHEDYSKPLEVVWLCPRHHKQAHKNTPG